MIKPELDTSTPIGRLVFDIGGRNRRELEREIMLERQREALAKAKAAGQVQGPCSDGAREG